MMRKVLLINDSRFESIIIKDILSSLGYNVIISDEDNAITAVKSTFPDVVIANLNMKIMRGDQLISLIKVHNPEIKCLLSSNNPIRLSEVNHKRVDAFFQTPIDRNSLEKIIAKIIN